MTLQECMALPEFEGFGVTEKVIDGVRIRVPTMGRPIGAMFVSDDTPLVWFEPDGSSWMLGRYQDGAYFKRRR